MSTASPPATGWKRKLAMTLTALFRARFPALVPALFQALVPALFSALLPALFAVQSVEAQTSDVRTYRVSDVPSLLAAIDRANRTGHSIIELAPGDYQLERTVSLRGDHITLRSMSGDAASTQLIGAGMRQNPVVENLINVSGRNVALIGLTLRDAGNHLVQLNGERNADHFRMINCRLFDAYEQLFKVSKNPASDASADFGLVRDSTFAYSDELGPNDYIGGIDLHGGKEWLIENNRFENIASPRRGAAEHAVHIWSGSANNRVSANLILNSDRGIGFGLTADPRRHNRGGEITGNVIINLRTSNPFSDVGIGLESSPQTVVAGNYIFLAHDYPNAIEYRFAATRDALITGNVVNRSIAARDGGHAVVEGNRTSSTAESAWNRIRYLLRRTRQWLKG
ncbi:MAG: right-handed parallel beta-helix repeat-containing protein [Pseudomonadota bacterium]